MTPFLEQDKTGTKHFPLGDPKNFIRREQNAKKKKLFYMGAENSQ